MGESKHSEKLPKLTSAEPRHTSGVVAVERSGERQLLGDIALQGQDPRQPVDMQEPCREPGDMGGPEFLNADSGTHWLGESCGTANECTFSGHACVSEAEQEALSSSGEAEESTLGVNRRLSSGLDSESGARVASLASLGFEAGSEGFLGDGSGEMRPLKISGV